MRNSQGTRNQIFQWTKRRQGGPRIGSTRLFKVWDREGGHFSNLIDHCERLSVRVSHEASLVVGLRRFYGRDIQLPEIVFVA